MKDLSYCEGKPIAVCGAGGIGKAIAADCVLAGQDVILCEDERFAPKSLANLEHGFNFHGRQPNKIGLYRAGIAKFDKTCASVIHLPASLCLPRKASQGKARGRSA